MEKIKLLHQKISKVLESAQSNYKHSKLQDEKSWEDYWHGKIDGLNLVLLEVEEIFKDVKFNGDSVK